MPSLLPKCPLSALIFVEIMPPWHWKVRFLRLWSCLRTVVLLLQLPAIPPKTISLTALDTDQFMFRFNYAFWFLLTTHLTLFLFCCYRIYADAVQTLILNKFRPWKSFFLRETWQLTSFHTFLMASGNTSMTTYVFGSPNLLLGVSTVVIRHWWLAVWRVSAPRETQPRAQSNEWSFV